MHITVNGEQTSIVEGTTLLSLIESRGLDPQAVVAELNLDIVPAGTFADVRLNPGDSLELLQFVGGG
ncbi:MAG: sulfur carrier protein ThiS [Mailhella sp.]|nr:sulfur carrier protein ThiS [Mailhella sp.]MBQ9105188.1 sulfur carrier protein ThiS [Mailhella sp.]